VNSADAALLRALRSSAIFFPPTELAAQAGLPRADLAARIDVLREAGFEIDERPGLGYRLIATPDRLIADDLFSRLGNCALVREIVVFEETDSTNERAGKLGRAGAASGLTIFAEHQTAGRGRFGRRWESSAHLGLWFSLLLRPIFPLENWPRLTTWAAVAIAAALERSLDVRAEIKWPNDVFVGGKKVAGILIETGIDQAQESFAVVGIGVNANHAAEDFPAELAAKATSLRVATGRTIDRPALAAAILRELDRRFPEVDRRFPELIAEAAQRSLLLGRWVQVRSGDATLEGSAEGLDANGQLLLRTADATLQTLSAGEVTIVGMSS
jgi:BirA family biotin operon repressor/biotin-[acetyl-CoA-carboxylase] ligase